MKQMTCSVDGCDRDIESRGLCHAHSEYRRRTGKMPTKPILDTPEKRLMAKVVKQENGCWLWTGATAGGGRYGVIGQAGTGTTRQAHRVSFELFRGPIPEGAVLDHLCRITLCVNPDHLDPVTQQENVLRGESLQSENARKTNCPRGHPYDMTTSNGGRWCRTCHREAGRESQRRLRARRKAAG